MEIRIEIPLPKGWEEDQVATYVRTAILIWAKSLKDHPYTNLNEKELTVEPLHYDPRAGW